MHLDEAAAQMARMPAVGQIDDQTGMVSIMYANNEVGTIQPIRQLAEIARRHNAVFHTDAVQAIGKIPFKIPDIDVDMLSLSGHKLYGPKGTGVLYIKKGVHFCPLILGGHHERNRRAGTENNLGIIGLGKAFEMLNTVHNYKFKIFKTVFIDLFVILSKLFLRNFRYLS